MKKRATAAALMIVPLVVASGCGTASAAGTKGASAPAHGARSEAVEPQSSTQDITLNGAGANSAAPFYDTVFAQYEKATPGVTINYSPAGSSVGVTDIEEGTVNFGDSEIPMAASDLDKAKATVGNVLQLPIDLGGVAISYNLPGAPSGLKLSGPVLADIFDGTVTNWDSPEIAKVTGDKKLPNLAIVPVHRADSSGPGWDLDQYLIDTSPAWVKAVGTTTPSKTWPLATVGIGQQLNTGVATYIGQTQGAIGFVEYAYARKAKFAVAALENQAGDFVAPDFQTIEAAGKKATHLSWSNFDIVYSKGAQSYPLTNFSWALLAQKQSDTTTGDALKALYSYVITTGQKYSNFLGYATLPKIAVTIGKLTLSELQNSSGQPLS
jgi:phosphate transport system substrate-binding protein